MELYFYEEPFELIWIIAPKELGILLIQVFEKESDFNGYVNSFDPKRPRKNSTKAILVLR